MNHERHFTLEEANALLARVEPMLVELRDARDRAHRRRGARGCSRDAAPANGGGEPGRSIGEAFLAVRRLLGELAGAGIVVRDIDRGLIDFPAIRDEREVYLCWELGEDRVGFWHELETGFGGRQPLE